MKPLNNKEKKKILIMLKRYSINSTTLTARTTDICQKLETAGRIGGHFGKCFR